jgi:hypothetical protein
VTETPNPEAKKMTKTPSREPAGRIPDWLFATLADTPATKTDPAAKSLISAAVLFGEINRGTVDDFRYDLTRFAREAIADAYRAGAANAAASYKRVADSSLAIIDAETPPTPEQK